MSLNDSHDQVQVNGTELFLLEPTTSEIIEMFYQLTFFMIGTPVNVWAFMRTTRNIREGGVESRLVKLSRQLLIAHIIVLFVYGVWRSYWFFNIVWVQGDVMCKIYSFCCALPFHLWSNMVAAIAVDMLFCITRPLSSYRTEANRVNWLIGLAWLFAILCASPMIFLRGAVPLQTFNNKSLEQCYPLFDYYSRELLLGFNFFHVITTFYVPLGVIIVCYALIGVSLKKQMAERRLLHEGTSKDSLKQSSTKARFLKATLAIICTFFFTWLPYQILALLRVICDEHTYCQSITSRLSWLQAIIIASTCINPFLYQFGVKHRSRCSGNCSTLDSGTAVKVYLGTSQARTEPVYDMGRSSPLSFVDNHKTYSLN